MCKESAQTLMRRRLYHERSISIDSSATVLISDSTVEHNYWLDHGALNQGYSSDSQDNFEDLGSKLTREHLSDMACDYTSWKELFLVMMTLGFTLMAFVSIGNSQSFETHDIIKSPSIYVPGAGFSGFFYILGRLRSLRDPYNQNYYCFSAGCLGVVATLRNLTVDEVTDMAFMVQKEWWNGYISRFDIPRAFVDLLLPEQIEYPTDMFKSIHVITTGRPKSILRTATIIRESSSIEDLKNMLVQTTHIPFATGWGLWKDDHMDGGFSLFSHPKCNYQVSLPFDLDLFKNIVNPNLSREKVHRFYRLGLMASNALTPLEEPSVSLSDREGALDNIAWTSPINNNTQELVRTERLSPGVLLNVAKPM